MKSFPIRLWRDMFSELTWLLRHGIPLSQALSILLNQRRLKPLHFFFYHCIETISQGQPLSTAFELSPQSSLFQAFLMCGEKSGALDQALHQCTQWLTQWLQFQTQLRALLFYPLLLLIVLVGGSVLLMGLIVPQFHALYLSLNAPMPLSMEWLWATHVFLRDNGVWCLCGLSFFILFLIFSNHCSRLLLKVPAVKMLCHAHECAHLGMLLQGGIPLFESLHIVFNHAQFNVHRAALGRVMEEVSLGKSLTEAYRTVHWHDAYLCDMLNIAEYTGTLSVCYLKCHEYYHEQLDDRLKRFKQEWQPLILLGMGMIISVWVLLLYYPLIQLGYVVG